MGKTININNLSKEEINSFYDFVCDYELNIKNKYGNYNLNDTKLGIVLEREILALFLNKPMRKSISNMSH